MAWKSWQHSAWSDTTKSVHDPSFRCADAVVNLCELPVPSFRPIVHREYRGLVKHSNTRSTFSGARKQRSLANCRVPSRQKKIPSGPIVGVATVFGWLEMRLVNSCL